MESKELSRLSEITEGNISLWHQWGPYVSERSWGTVREDYSWNGDAWNYFPYDIAQSKVFRWGEDGIAGWCDRYQVLVFAPAFWNGKDHCLKERLFGLSSAEGNHGEDVKEYYFYLDGTPTHSYMKYLYKYPQAEFPYKELREENRKRGTKDPEYELIETGVFDQNRYFDIFIEYAKASEGDLCIRIEACNRGDREAPLHIIPHLWFRNQWVWGDSPLPKPVISDSSEKELCMVADDTNLQSFSNLLFDYHLGKRYLYGPKGGKALFTDNEDAGPDKKYVKEAFHKEIVSGVSATNPDKKGTKACFQYTYQIEPGDSAVLLLRFTDNPMQEPLVNVERIIAERKKEADEFYETVHSKGASVEDKRIQRQAFAGMLWNKQIYLFDVDQWLKGDNTTKPPPVSRLQIRNIHWKHLNSMRVLSMPDKWEYPWFAAWDLAFHCITIAFIDIDYAKEQLWLMLFDQFQHPNGAIPAYEWEFSDLNPPVQAWAAYRLYEMEKKRTGRGDTDFLNKCFLKLLMNFAWWVNKVDSSGNNVFEGGFLGLDNITLFDRSKKFMEGATIQQSDGTGWMAMFCLNLMRIALELAKTIPSYEALATKFFQHFAYIAHAIKNMGQKGFGLWSEEDHFFYDALSLPNGDFTRFRVRSIVGIIPLFAVDIITKEELAQFPEFAGSFAWFLQNRKEITNDCVSVIDQKETKGYLLSLVKQGYIENILKYVWDSEEFKSPYGLRSLSKFHEKHPFFYQDRQVGYEPGESMERIKGGNSNWRGPIWMAPTFLLVESLKKFSLALGEGFIIKVGNEPPVNLKEMATSFCERVINLFTPNELGARPFYGPLFPFAADPYWRDYLLFYEYYNPETGKGLGASHQTGWSGLVANFVYEKEG